MLTERREPAYWGICPRIGMEEWGISPTMGGRGERSGVGAGPGRSVLGVGVEPVFLETIA
jgi:hypothetical protein